eukprot:TCONS_00054206-protein
MEQKCNRKCKSSIKAKWKELYTTCSFDGFHYIFEERGFLRFFWVTVILSAVFLAILLFYNVMEQFFQHEVTTNLLRQSSEEDLHFPTITICNLNSVWKEKVEQNNYNLSTDEIVKFYQDMRNGLFNPDNLKVLMTFEANGVHEFGDIVKLFELNMTDMA